MNNVWRFHSCHHLSTRWSGPRRCWSRSRGRPAGPRGAGSKAEIDVEIERYLAERLIALVPARLVGEETPTRPSDGSPYCWLVDPHDGTWAYLRGPSRLGGVGRAAARRRAGARRRLRAHEPGPRPGPDRLGGGACHTCCATASRVSVDLSRAGLRRRRDRLPGSQQGRRRRSHRAPPLQPARFISMPSIAYRLARVAAGDGVATLSLGAPAGLDYAAGHALPARRWRRAAQSRWSGSDLQLGRRKRYAPLLRRRSRGSARTGRATLASRAAGTSLRGR